MLLNCLICKKEFKAPPSWNRKFCSNFCRGKSKQKRIRKKCLSCGKEFSIKPCLKEKRLYCSHFCSAPINRSKHKTDPKEIGKKISLTLKGKMPKNIDLILEKGAEYRFKKGQFAKEKHPNWKGGIGGRDTGSELYKQWRKSIFERDDYRCFDCGERSGKLEADHIFQWSLFPRLRYDINNGQTVCKSCHRERTRQFLKVHWKNQFTNSSMLKNKNLI